MALQKGSGSELKVYGGNVTVDDAAKVLEVRGLQVNLRTAEGSVPLLAPIDFELKKGVSSVWLARVAAARPLRVTHCSTCLIRAGWRCRAASV